jgi:hypothetical protein
MEHENLGAKRCAQLIVGWVGVGGRCMGKKTDRITVGAPGTPHRTRRGGVREHRTSRSGFYSLTGEPGMAVGRAPQGAVPTNAGAYLLVVVLFHGE